MRRLLLLYLFLIISANELTTQDLIYVQAIWRHGDRAPDYLPYPNDAYNETAWPHGWGQLTDVGTLILQESTVHLFE